ncbi:MAG TPA: hypothetical protein VGF01_05735, partial [Terracidiphilus sp.]
PPTSSTQHTEFRILDYVRATRKDSRNWWARCPSCAQAGHDRTGDNLAIQIRNPRDNARRTSGTRRRAGNR